MADDAARIAQLEAENAVLRELYAGSRAEVEHLRPALTQALEQQTATAEVLRAIASAPTSLDTLVASAARLTRADEAALLKIEGSTLPIIASTGGASGGQESDISQGRPHAV
jgi:hypothetical protein